MDNLLTLKDYWRGRDTMYAMDLTPDIIREATRTVDLANKLLNDAALHGVNVGVSPVTGSCCSSGWRPPDVNAGTPNAAPNSNHMTGRAIDIYDPDGDLDEWLMTAYGQAALASLGLWMEHPSATKGWSHLQTIPPHSGKRVYHP